MQSKLNVIKLKFQRLQNLTIFPNYDSDLISYAFGWYNKYLQLDFDEEYNGFTKKEYNYTTDANENDGIESVEFINKDLPRDKVFADITQFLVSKMEYFSGKNLFGFPYDYRLGLGNEIFAEKFLNLIEKAFKVNNKKLILIAHEYGALKVLSSIVQNESIAKKIEKIIMINAPLGGSNMALFEVFHGNKSSKKNKNYFYGKVHSKNVKKTEAIYSLMVNVRNVEYDQAIYMDRSRNVSMSDYRMFFSPREIIQYEKNKYIHEQIHNLMSKTDIRICCISATTISSTISFYDYDTKTTHYVSGDGRTTADSINICEDYIGKADVLKINVEDNTYEPLAISNQGNSHVKIKNFIRNKIESQN